MAKSIYSKEYNLFLRHLRAARKLAGLTQGELAVRLRRTQAFVSKCERGERRVDFIELRHFCSAMGISVTRFVKTLEKAVHDECPSSVSNRSGALLTKKSHD